MIPGFRHFKKFTAALTLALFLSQSSFPLWDGALRAWAQPYPVEDLNFPVYAPLKSEVGVDAEDYMGDEESTRKANVLFMIDATAGMQFHPKGVMPSVVLKNDPITENDLYWTQSEFEGAEWGLTKSAYGYGAKDIIEMMSNATFGIGAMPVAWSEQNLRAQRNLYGRDIDETNNYVKMSEVPSVDLYLNAQQGRYYYAPFMDSDANSQDIKRVQEGYANQKTGLEIERTGVGDAISKIKEGIHWDLKDHEKGKPKIAYNYGASGNKISGANKKFPYALVFKNPDYWESGMSGLAINASPPLDELVPNDSKLYQTKFVLWKLLEDGDRWSNLRLGLATTYLPTTNDAVANTNDHKDLADRFDFNGMYKVKPFGTNAYTQMMFDSNGNPTDYSNEDSTTGRLKYENGVLTQAISGHVRGYNSLHAQYYPMWSHQTVDPLYSAIGNSKSDQKYAMQKIYKTLHRGSLLVPIRGYDETWASGSKPTMKHADRIRQWINGYADLYNGTSNGTDAASGNTNRSKQWHYYKDPEIGVAGLYILPHAIYPDPRPAYWMTRQNYLNHTYAGGATWDWSASERNKEFSKEYFEKKGGDKKKGYEAYDTSIWYSHVTKNTDWRHKNLFPSSSTLEDSEQESKSRFNGGSGEVAGTILDFFSPPLTSTIDSTVYTLYPNYLAPISYPIRSRCEPNWVIIITSGQELKTVDSSSYVYTAAQAIKNLYDATDKSRKDEPRYDTANDNPLLGNRIYANYERVTMLERASDDVTPTGNPTAVDLDFPIRTLVVGVLPKADDSSLTEIERKDVREMYVNITKMAVAGQGGNPDDIKTYDDTINPPFSAFIAEDPKGLTDAIMAALTIINDSTVMQPASGTMAQSETIEDLDEQQSDIYSYQYRILRSDQWEAHLRRDIVSMDADGAVRFYHKWTTGEKGDPDHLIAPLSGNRDVRYWKGGWQYPDLVTLNSAQYKETFGTLSGLNDAHVAPPSGYTFDEKKPYDAFADWLWGYDYSYSKKSRYRRPYMFTDVGQGGIVMVHDPVVNSSEVDPLPGYNAWAAALSPKSPVLYVHTNDGLLRLIDPTPAGDGKELMAIVPPPMLIPARLSTLKAGWPTGLPDGWTQGDKLPMLNVDDQEGTGGYMSYPAFTLDGSLQKRNFDLEQKGDGTGWGEYLLGALGRGGSGLYMLDVSTHDKPVMKWYREKISDDLLVSSKVPEGASSNVAYVYSASAGDFGNDEDKGYLKLGFNSPKPVMGVTPLPGNGLQNFIAIAGGAMSDVPIAGNLDKNGGEGATLLIIEPKDGSIIRAFTGSSVPSNWRLSSQLTGTAPVMGMMVSEPTAFRSNSSAYLTGGIIAADNRGNIFEVDMEDRETHAAQSPEGWTIRTIATLQKDTASQGSYAMPYGVVVSRQPRDNAMWVAGGTTDIKTRKNAKDKNDVGILKNSEQMIFSFMTSAAQTEPYNRDDFVSLSADKPDDTFSISQQSGKKGWYLPLEGGTQQNSFREYVCAKPVLINGTLFVATFIQKNKVVVQNSSECGFDRPFDGDSRIYAIDIKTGKPTMWVNDDGKTLKKYETFEHVKVSSMPILARGGKGKMAIILETLAAETNLAYIAAKNPSININENGPPTIDPPPLPGNGGVPPSATVINYWLMK